jgi:hypothetical protein
MLDNLCRALPQAWNTTPQAFHKGKCFMHKDSAPFLGHTFARTLKWIFSCGSCPEEWEEVCQKDDLYQSDSGDA